MMRFQQPAESAAGGGPMMGHREVMAQLLAIALLALSSAGCSGDATFTPDECEALPQYNIRNASQRYGAVAEQGTVAEGRNPGDPPPLSGVEQRELQILARNGCVTLPGTEHSLPGAGSADSDAGAP